LLQSQNQATPIISRVYCEPPAVNAAVCHYAGLAEQAGIRLEIALDIPSTVAVDALELSMVVSNLMGNPCAEDTVLDENGYPLAYGDGHGIGSKSVIAFVKKYDGELMYKIENGVFRVRLLV